MKKFVSILLFLLFIAQCSLAYEDDLRSSIPVLLQKGSFIKVANIRTISTAIADEGDEVSFVAPTSVWCGEALIFPKETMFYGFVEELNEPVQGTNAAIKLKINKVVLPDGRAFALDAYVTKNGDAKLGGELTPPMEYTRMPHYIEFRTAISKGVLQYVPGNKRFFGNHLVIKPGLELVLTLNSDYNAEVIDF